MDIILKFCLFTAVFLTGILCGASLDQSFKQLPARHMMGMIRFSEYVKAADLKNGVVWYAISGIGSALSTIITAFIVWRHHEVSNFGQLVYAAAICAIMHTICTTQAAPTYFKQKMLTDENQLSALFKKFEIIQAISAIFILLNFMLLLGAIFVLL